jgi:hypothetical protein
MWLQMTLSTLRAHRYWPGRNWAVLAALLLVTNLFVLGLWYGASLDAQENHVLELAQGGFLVLVCGVCGARAWSLAKTAPDLNFLLHAGLALLSYSFLLREVDIDQLGAAPAWAHLEQALRLFGVALWLALLMFVAPRVKQLWSERAIMFAMPMVWLAMLGGALLVASWPFDKQLFSVLPYLTSQFIEEMLELDGCMILFFASLAD